jgi:hypothetical protein
MMGAPSADDEAARMIGFFRANTRMWPALVGILLKRGERAAEETAIARAGPEALLATCDAFFERMRDRALLCFRFERRASTQRDCGPQYAGSPPHRAPRVRVSPLSP